MTFELGFKVLEGIEDSWAVKAFMIFPVVPFDLAVVSGDVCDKGVQAALIFNFEQPLNRYCATLLSK